MKGLICSLVLVFCSFILKAQYPVQQNIGSASTLVKTPNYGGLQGGLITYTFVDTTSANTALSYLKMYNGALIYTSGDSSLWFRSGGASKWTQILPSGGGTGSNGWLTRGNDLSGQSLPNRLGTKNGDGLNIITNDLIRMIIPVGGIVRSSSAQNKFLVIDTVGKEIYYTDGGGSIPTWQQTLTSGSTITSNVITANNTVQTYQWDTHTQLFPGIIFSSSSTTGSGTAPLVSVIMTGANVSASKTSLGQSISVTRTGTTSINTALNLEASGASTNNALYITAGAISLNGSAGTSGQVLTSAGTGTLPTWTTPTTGTVTGSGTANQVAYWSSTSAITGTAGFTFSGTVLTFPTPFTLGATSVTTTGTQLNYLNAATGTTGTTSTNVVFSTSPALTTPTVVTSIVGGASFDAFNTVSTTLNFGGAATTMTIGGTPTTAITHNYSTNATATATTKTVNVATGGAAGSTTNVNIASVIGGTTALNSPIITIGGGTTASDLRFFEGSGGGANYVGFKANATLAGNTIYTLPTAFPAGTYLLNSTSAGVMGFTDPSTFLTALTNGNGTTANGTAVDLGGTMNANIDIDDDSPDNHSLQIGKNTNLSLIQLRASALQFNLGTVQMDFYGAGAATFDASGNISSVSDIRLKNKQGNYSGGLKELMQINPIIYKWKPESGMETKHDYIGFSAQNIRSSLGEDAIGINKQGYLSIQDRAILAVAINAIQELKELNDKQQKEIEDLKKQIKMVSYSGEGKGFLNSKGEINSISDSKLKNK